MKTTILLMFSLFLITGTLPGQKDKFNYIDSDIRNIFYPDLKTKSPRLRKPNLNVPQNPDNLTKKNLHRFNQYRDSSFKDYYTVRRYPDFVIVEEYPGSSRYYGNQFNIKPGKNGKLLIKKPDTSAKYYLIIKDPVPHRFTK